MVGVVGVVGVEGVGGVGEGTGVGRGDGAGVGEKVSTETASTVSVAMLKRRCALAPRRRRVKLRMFASRIAPLELVSFAMMCSCTLLPSAAAIASGTVTSVAMYTVEPDWSVQTESENVPSPSPIVLSMPFWKMVSSKSLVQSMPPSVMPVRTIGTRVGLGVGKGVGFVGYTVLVGASVLVGLNVGLAVGTSVVHETSLVDAAVMPAAEAYERPASQKFSPVLHAPCGKWRVSFTRAFGNTTRTKAHGAPRM